MTPNLLTLDEAKAFDVAADLVQEEKHTLGLRAASCTTHGDFEGASAYEYAARCLQRVEDKLRAKSAPVARPAHVEGRR